MTKVRSAGERKLTFGGRFSSVARCGAFVGRSGDERKIAGSKRIYRSLVASERTEIRRGERCDSPWVGLRVVTGSTGRRVVRVGVAYLKLLH